MRADKNKAIVIIEREALNQKIEKFIQDNNIVQIAKDPTQTYQSQIQQLLQTSNLISVKEKRKCLINRKPAAAKLNAPIKIHKEGTLIRPVINSMQAPSYKFAKHFIKKLKNLLNLPHQYSAKVSKEVAGE
jgi:tRNA U34 5-methylaminomethyl-2-thiouridine-forming methyltransferase MnmC